MKVSSERVVVDKKISTNVVVVNESTRNQSMRVIGTSGYSRDTTPVRRISLQDTQWTEDYIKSDIFNAVNTV